MQDFLDKPHSLPDTMSDLLAAAIADARQLDTNLYRPNNEEWHNTNSRGICQVCLAGSVIAGSLNAPRLRTLTPWMFRGAVHRKLEALDYMRIGNWLLAYKTFHRQFAPIPTSNRLFHLPAPDHIYFKGWVQFRKHLDSLESILVFLRKIEEEEAPR